VEAFGRRALSHHLAIGGAFDRNIETADMLGLKGLVRPSDHQFRQKAVVLLAYNADVSAKRLPPRNTDPYDFVGTPPDTWLSSRAPHKGKLREVTRRSNLSGVRHSL